MTAAMIAGLVSVVGGIAAIIFAIVMSTRRAASSSFASSPSIAIEWAGTAIQPWTNLDLAIRASLEVLAAEYATYPDLQRWRLEIFGANDRMFLPGQITADPYLDSDGELHTLMGTTQRVTAFLGLGGGMVVRIKQIRTRRTPLDPLKPHVVSFSGPIVDPESSPLWDELACRLVPMVVDGTIGGYVEPWMTLRAKMVTRYLEIRAKAGAT